MDPSTTIPYWSRPIKELMSELGTSVAGLSETTARAHLAQYGPNRVNEHRNKQAWRLMLDQFASPLVLILVFAVAVSMAAGEWIDALIIMAIVAGSGVLGFVQEYSAGAAIERLRARVTLKAAVVRDGRTIEISTADIVPGDLLALSAGSLVPADAVLVHARDFFVNQAVLTGEPFPVEKMPGPVDSAAEIAGRLNCVFMGSNVRSGTGTAVVVETGSRTGFGQIAARLERRPPKTEFENGLAAFGYMLTQAMVGLVLVVFAASLIDARPPTESLLFAVALAVGLAPELLPVIFTVTLSKGAQLMAEHGVIVRRLGAIEDLGSMDILCTDKTGTITEGVVQLRGAFDCDGRPSSHVLCMAGWNAHFQTGLVNALDEAILRECPVAGEGEVRKIDEVPYDFSRKRLSVVVRPRPGEAPLLVTKGAFDRVMEVCESVQSPDGVQVLDDSKRAAIRSQFEFWSAEGSRVVGVATRVVPEKERYSRADETNLRFLGFLLFFDPPKPGVGNTISELKKLGVQLKVITGDSRGVAVHLAQSVELEADRILTGADLRAMGDDALWQAAERTSLFVEMDPSQKERVIRALRASGHVVGYLGDGINDAPALHAASVGISVDGAVDVAKEAADIVLLEHDLDVLRQGIEQGRGIFANTIKYILTTTSANFGNMLSMAAASLFLPFLPLLAKQILLNNFLSDVPGLAIATDHVDPEWVASPRRWNVQSVRRFMVTFGLVSVFFDLVTFALLWKYLAVPADVFRTAWFVESLLTELLIALVVRTARPCYRSRPGLGLAWTTGIVAALTLAIPYLPGSGLFGFVPLSPAIMASILAIAAAYVAATEWVKRIVPPHV